MTTRAKQSSGHVAHGADPWWGDAPIVDEAPAAPAEATRLGTRDGGRRTKQSRRGTSRRRTRSGIGWVLLGLLLAPIRGLWAWMLGSRSMRRMLIKAGIVLSILLVIACSVGVILINNVVMGRTAELGALDDKRRELRRENALLGAQAAKLSASPVVVRRATKELGMVRNPTMPKFVYLDGDHHALTPGQRRRIIVRKRQRLAKATERAAARASADAKSASATDTAASSTDTDSKETP